MGALHGARAGGGIICREPQNSRPTQKQAGSWEVIEPKLLLRGRGCSQRRGDQGKDVGHTAAHFPAEASGAGA